jgi:TFIIF-interacting CTD phosphatase-like protein
MFCVCGRDLRSRSHQPVSTLMQHLLILDLDESLVFSAENPSDPKFDFRLSSYEVVKRPFLDEFVNRVFEWFDIAIWTAATEDYAQAMIRELIPYPHLLKFVWSRRRCTLRYDYERKEYYWLKDLKKVKRLGYKLEKVLIIEDEPRSMQRSYGNLILTHPFDGNPGDNELQTLTQYLEWIRGIANVRTVDKRYWRRFRKEKLA